MLIVETISKVRLAHLRKGLSIREISRLYSLSRNTVRKILRSDVIDQKYVRSVQPLRKLGCAIRFFWTVNPVLTGQQIRN